MIPPLFRLTEDDLTDWIAKHRLMFRFHYKHYTPDYVSWLARMAGFDPEMVYRRFSHFDDALALTSIDRRARQKATWFESEVLMQNNLCLQDQWQSLDLYETLGIEFDEAA